MKYALLMKDKNGKWKVICTSASKDYLDTLADQLEKDGEKTNVEAIVDEDVTV